MTASSSSNYLQRLQNEFYNQMITLPLPGIKAFPASDSCLTIWTAIITGPINTPYEKLNFEVNLLFPPSYPFKPPTVKFKTKTFHPNIDAKGNVCLDILKNKWSAVYNIRTVLISLQVLLGNPNNESPLNWTAAELWGESEKYRQRILEIYDYKEEDIEYCSSNSEETDGEVTYEEQFENR